jgi:diguanylate cyclase (GGDEF)-like protein
VYFIDLDLFKAVNDTHGHDIGDELLVAVARRLTGLLRPADTLARLSGDEYVALCEDLTDPDQAAAIGARMTTALSRPFPLTGVPVSVTASVGIAYAGEGDDRIPERLLRDADMAMYQAKHRGGARQQLFDPREQRLADRQAGLERDLHHAVPRQELHLDYQPIVATADGRITGFEALLRWQHPTRGLIPPTTLIPLAEQSALITEIGAWVLDRAWATRNHWRRPPGGDELTVAVNVSAHQVMSPGFTAAVAGVLNTADIDPALLTLEITESVFIRDGDRALLVLGDLKTLGVILALDDFGTGYSSLNYLRRFPVDIIKIDRAFISDLGRDRASTAIVDAVVTLAHALGMTVIAEGVETTTQHHQVAELGCDSCQGNYFATPMPTGHVHDLLECGARDNPRLPTPTPQGNSDPAAATT